MRASQWQGTTTSLLAKSLNLQRIIQPGFSCDSQERRVFTVRTAYRLQLEIIQEHHSSVTAGHFSWSRTVNLISRQFWWPNLRNSVQEFIKGCASCQRNKSSTQRPFGLLQPISNEIPDTRWHTVTLNFITDLPQSSRGNDAILVLVDKLTMMDANGVVCYGHTMGYRQGLMGTTGCTET